MKHHEIQGSQCLSQNLLVGVDIRDSGYASTMASNTSQPSWECICYAVVEQCCRGWMALCYGTLRFVPSCEMDSTRNGTFSLTLFIIFMDRIPRRTVAGCWGEFSDLRILFLLFADDVILLALTRISLQFELLLVSVGAHFCFVSGFLYFLHLDVCCWLIFLSLGVLGGRFLCLFFICYVCIFLNCGRGLVYNSVIMARIFFILCLVPCKVDVFHERDREEKKSQLPFSLSVL